MNVWQPIETAPRDGTKILLSGGDFDQYYDRDGDKAFCAVGWYDKSCSEDFDFWRFCSFDGGVYGEYSYPTHWMPLPEPPK